MMAGAPGALGSLAIFNSSGEMGRHSSKAKLREDKAKRASRTNLAAKAGRNGARCIPRTSGSSGKAVPCTAGTSGNLYLETPGTHKGRSCVTQEDELP